MDGSIDFTMQVYVQGNNSNLVMEAAEDPGLIFIGGQHQLYTNAHTDKRVSIYKMKYERNHTVFHDIM